MEAQYTTDNIRLDPQKCQACDKCVEECPSNVFALREESGRVHAYVANPDGCKGFMTCVHVCPDKAISRRSE